MADDGVGVLRGVRRTAIIAIVVSLVVAAGLGIWALLSGEFGELQGKVLLSTLTVAGFGTTALCHLAVVARAVRVVGCLGIAASVVAAVAAFVLIWRDWSDPWDPAPLVKTLAVAAIAGASLAQANLLLLLAGRRRIAIRLPLALTLVAVAAVAVMIALPVLTDGDIPGEHGEPYFRALGVLGILDALGTIALPILGLVLRAGADGASSGPAAVEATPGVPSRLDLELPPELERRLRAAAGYDSREATALAALDRALPRLDESP
ncbi:MAG: hypothetical protein J0G30_10935 [Actinomycetales bacterium]|nr:hypothetical protein [Actinomycetales bacterium]